MPHLSMSEQMSFFGNAWPCVCWEAGYEGHAGPFLGLASYPHPKDFYNGRRQAALDMAAESD